MIWLQQGNKFEQGVIDMKKFIPIWLGQLISLVGSGLTGFALGVWVYENTGLVTYFSIISLFTSLPSIIFSPFAGALADRWDKRWSMIISDAGAGICTLIIVFLILNNKLQLWHIYLLMGISSVFNAFQWPAFISMSSAMVEHKDIGRVGGMMQLAQGVSYVISPMLGGVLYSKIRLEGVIAIDFITLMLAIGTLFLIKLERTEIHCQLQKDFIINDVKKGLEYIVHAKGLLGLLLFFSVLNFISASISVLATPFILSMVSTSVLGAVLSIGAIGMLIGGTIMSVWGGPQNRMRWIYIFSIIGGICVILAGLARSIVIFTVVSFIFFLSVPIISSSNQTIWQMKVDLDIQGRVFAIRSMFATISMPLAYLIIGPLADNVFEPLFSGNGNLSSSVGKIIGVGPGRGIAFMFVILGSIFILASIIAYLYKPIRILEKEIPNTAQRK